MLGQKRNASLFATPEAPKLPAQEEYTEPIPDKASEPIPAPYNNTILSEEDAPPVEVKAIVTGRAHSLFFTPDNESRDFPDVCREVQGYIAANYSSLMTGSADSREQIKRYAAKYIQDKRIAVKGMTPDELVDAIYAEMAEYGFLTK